MFDLARESSYPTPLAHSAFLPLMLMSLASQKNSPSPTRTPNSIRSEYDYIIVGAGSAGSTVAARLSELPCVTVLLLEAGRDPPLLNDIPAYGLNFWFSDIDWAYKTVPQKYAATNLKNRQIVWPSGKGLGGSSLLNSEIVVRGNKQNYNDWAAQGAKGWSYSEVLHYFKKLENETDPIYLANGYHGKDGPVTIETIPYNPKLKMKVLEGVEEMGYEILDSNAARQTGFYISQGNLRNGQRCSTAKAYLVPAENRPNLDILPNAFVHKVNIKNGQAVGVTFDVNGTIHKVAAKKEVIMSAGTVNSAQLLMLSGIGPKEELKKHGIPLVADLPVGKNLQDHCSALNLYTLDSSIPPFPELISSNRSFQQYINNRTGPLSSLEGLVATAFLNNGYIRPKFDNPNYQLYITAADAKSLKQLGLTDEAYRQTYQPYEGRSVYLCDSEVLQPKSRGTVTLQSADPHKPPLIDPNYFAVSEDLEDIVEGIKTCQRLSETQAMKSIGAKPLDTVYPGCEKFQKYSDDYYRCHARSAQLTQSHEVGTAKMGHPNDPTTVVDPELRVKGIKGLRVVDASIMPIVPSGNTNIPTIMIAEKASDIIKGSIHCQN
ncbi:glucose dehydrogenase [FAD, quinone] isoform X1 [Parasteatoda tepidariorum]|uniref:glucose dehydrogenase [FAD, quinone] isoform X1 n=1 Tax=Parasteatoda tepidariorum TaxID=114398 RepID=UPI001C723FD3|nr:glucose dehydrogenase [FAD, quinone]-like isoform X1 [Parasteatoda tepidariorum]